MNILHVIGSFDKKNGGTYSAIESITSIENSLGYKNEILSIAFKDQEYDHEVFGNKLNLFKPSFYNVFRQSKLAYRWLHKNIKNYDLMILHEVWGILAVRAAFLAKKNGVKYIIWPHGSLDPFDLQKKKLLKIFLGKLLIKNVTLNASAICCTSVLEKSVLKTYNKKSENVHILPLAINYEIKGDKSRFRQKYSIYAQDTVFLFLSRVDYKKGVDLFLKAYKSILEKHEVKNIKLLIAGKGTREYESYIQKLVTKLEIANYVTMCGFLSGSDKADAYAGSDCFILPSMNENYGISVVEALQSNLPVLISDNVYIWHEIMPDGGWVCQYEICSIANSIETIHTYMTEKRFYKNPQKAGNKFKKEKLLNEYLKFYELVLDK